MRRIHQTIVIVLLSLSVVSCKVDFDFSELDGKPILYLDMNLTYAPYSYTEEAIPQDAPSSLRGYVYAVPPTAEERDFPEDLYCRMKVFHNSELVWARDNIRLNEFEGLVSADIYDIVPGDELKITAQADGFPTATSTITVPQATPQIMISHTRINASKFRISITFEDNPATEDNYAFIFEKAYWYEDSLQPSGLERLEPSFGSSEDTSFLDLGPFNAIWEDGNKFYGISDREFNGKKKTIDINVEYPLSSPEYAEYAYYSICIHKVSQERLRYEIACQDKGNNILGFIGLAPTTFSYTNIVGGSGCISCAYAGRTEWIAVP